MFHVKQGGIKMYYDSLYGGVDKKPEDYDTEIEYITNKKMIYSLIYSLL